MTGMITMKGFEIVNGNVQFSFEKIFATVDADNKSVRIFTSTEFENNVISVDMTFEQFTKFANNVKKQIKEMKNL
jgi:hypothetical protein